MHAHKCDPTGKPTVMVHITALAPIFAPCRPQASQERHSSYGIEPRALINFYWKSILGCLQHMPCDPSHTLRR